MPFEPNKLLHIDWTVRPYHDTKTKSVAIRDPVALLSKLAPTIQWTEPLERDRALTCETFFLEVQEMLLKQANTQLGQVESRIETLKEETLARGHIVEIARSYLVKQVSTLRIQLLALSSKGDSTTWKPTAQIESLELVAELERRISSGVYQSVARAHHASSIPPIPPSTRRSRPAYNLPKQASYVPVPRESAETLISSEEPADGDTERESGGDPPNSQAETIGSATSREGLVGSHGGSADSPRGSAVDPPGPSGQMGDRDGPRSGQPGGGPEWPDDDSDSDPEPDSRRYPKRWQSWVKRRAERQAMNNAAQFLRDVIPQQPTQQVIHDFKSPDPKCFKGDPEDLDRFLHQLEDKFCLEPNRFTSDVTKIRYTGQRLEGKAYKWYRSYHLQISSRDAYRVRGIRELDPQYASWDRFESALRSSFGERITRAQAVREWDRLRHKDSIDDFIDEITRLMWLTGYEMEVVEDKIREGLNNEMGHAIEDAHRQRQPKAQNPSSNEGSQDQGQQSKGKDANSTPRSKGKGKGGGRQQSGKTSKPSNSKVPKNREERLKGISEGLQEERKRDDKCIRCGKPNNRWIDCWTKDPVTTRVASDPSTGGKRTLETGQESKGQKKAKSTAAVKTEKSPAVAAGRIIEIPSEDKIGEDFDIWALP